MIYLKAEDAIAGLHTKGYDSDFQLFGNDLLWIQEKIFIRSHDFSITECHQFFPRLNETVIVFGILSSRHHAMGILLNDYRSYTASTPPVIAAKLAAMRIVLLPQKY